VLFYIYKRIVLLLGEYQMENSEKINILVVDDKPENLLSLEAIIDQDEYNLIKAHSGEEALKYLLKYDFALILLDVQMPGMDRFATAKIIKAREKTKYIPILFITANNMDTEHIFIGYSLGAIDYILKPLDPLILKSKVDRFVEMYKMRRKLSEQAKQLEERNKQIEYMAFHDSLTDLPNRRYFNEKILLKVMESKRLNESFALLYLDLDNFTYVNNALGYAMGDRLLIEVSIRLKSCIREDDFLARVGEDEFHIILSATDREKALEITEAIQVAFEEPFLIDQYELHVTTCIGLCVFPFDGEDSITLMKNAEAALHRAKELGKNKFKVFHSGLNIYSYRTYLIQSDLRKAIERNELEIYFQPKVSVQTKKMTSAEAILSWNHPQWGFIPPEEFIPIAEETGYIVEIGKWVFQHVCKHLEEWKKNHLHPVPIAINFSVQQFLQKNLIPFIKEEISKANIQPEWIEIEITESILIKNESVIFHTVSKLREMGIQISLDDFGTGYSSINYLRKLTVDKLKIDKSFIQDLTNNQSNSEGIVRSIIVLAENLHLSVVAEGVETEEQFNKLKELQCDEVQGYYFSQPLSLKDFEKLLQKRIEEKSDILGSDQSYQDSSNHIQSLKLDSYDENMKNEIVDSSLQHLQEEYTISSREMDVFHLLIHGLTNKEISDQLFISEHTVKNHITKIFQKLNVSDRLQAIALVYDTILKEGKRLLS
jgi:diguanylate cyclase (GGDEF)-like protein